MTIIDLRQDDRQRVVQTALLLLDGFAGTGTAAWTTRHAAMEEVESSLQADRISRVALDENGRVIGWIGAIRSYDGHAWELHPMVVDRQHQRRGIGRALVADLEEQVCRRGATTLYLGTDDENDRTSIGGVDLYPDVLGVLRTIRNRSDHPFEFYQRVGFVVVGVIPDANGLGKPDILMAKRIVAWPDDRIAR